MGKRKNRNRKNRNRLRTWNPSIDHCPQCKESLKEAAGLGKYCPNMKCNVLDNIDGEVIELNGKFYIKRRLNGGTVRTIAEAVRLDEGRCRVAEEICGNRV